MTTGQVVEIDSLLAWFEPRAESIEMAGQLGWIVSVPDMGVTLIGWVADGRMFRLDGNVAEDEFRALASGVRPASDAEWSQLTA